MRAKASGDLERGAVMMNEDIDRSRFASSPSSVSEDAEVSAIFGQWGVVLCKQMTITAEENKVRSEPQQRPATIQPQPYLSTSMPTASLLVEHDVAEQ